MNAWMPGEATYVTCRVELSMISEDIFTLWRLHLIEYATSALEGVPDEWRWELDLNVVELTAARETC